MSKKNFLFICPIEINREIINYLDYSECVKYLLTNKKELYDQYLNELLKLKKIYINNLLPNHISNILENYNYEEIKFLKFRKKFLGITEYIDRIKKTNVKHPIMFGIDNFERPFITFKIRINNKQNIVHTLFQRYSDYKFKWVFGTAYYTYNIHETTLPSDEDLNNYKKLVNGHNLNITDTKVTLFR